MVEGRAPPAMGSSADDMHRWLWEPVVALWPDARNIATGAPAPAPEDPSVQDLDEDSDRVTMRTPRSESGPDDDDEDETLSSDDTWSESSDCSSDSSAFIYDAEEPPADQIWQRVIEGTTTPFDRFTLKVAFYACLTPAFLVGLLCGIVGHRHLALH